MLIDLCREEARDSVTVAVRLMRRWVAARASHAPALPSLVALAGELGVRAEAAVALASLFQLTEECLGRPLEASCCCSPELVADEWAILLMLAASRRLPPPYAVPEIPHGLPAALQWAAFSARHLLGDGGASVPEHCAEKWEPVFRKNDATTNTRSGESDSEIALAGPAREAGCPFMA